MAPQSNGSHRHKGAFRLRVLFCAALGAAASAACNSVVNGWLDPTVLGSFERTGTAEIRTSLTLGDTPSGIPGASCPTPEDMLPVVREYPISGGDTLAIEINELRQRQVPYLTQVQVSQSGYVNLPVAGRVQAAGLTPPEFQEAVTDALRKRNVLVEPEVTVNPLYLNRATYSIFGIGVSAADNAPLRAGTFPIRRPDLRLLDAINQVGGLNEFVTEVYVFRRDEPEDQVNPATGAQQTAPAAPAPGQELLDAVAGDNRSESLQGDELERGSSEVPDLLEPEGIDPYIYVDGEFVPNPAYVEPGDDLPAAAPPSLGTVTPAVNWLRLAGDTAQRIIVVPAELLRAGDPGVNIVVRAGDVIRIVSGEIGAYYVMGQVNRVGVFAFNTEQVTLKAAIAAAGGLSSLAWPDRCTVYRRLGHREQMIQVNLDRIFAGLDPDFFIRRGDIINVGTHPFAPFLQRIRELTLPNPVSNVGYSFTYARNYADIDSFAVQQNPANKPEAFPNLFP